MSTGLSPGLPERALTLQSYLVLHSQHDATQKHPQALLFSRSVVETTSFSDVRPYPQRYLSSSSGSDDNQNLSLPPGDRSFQQVLPAFPDETLGEEIVEFELKLMDINQQIRVVLTDLTNCNSVRCDQSYKTWVHSRLLSVENQIKESE
jgi:hypothetical protein